jgi:drug/metabolite transporter (DMT)-like permease
VPGAIPGKPLTAPVRGALWMIGAAASLTLMAVLVRILAPRYSVLELIFLRNVVNLALMTPWIAHKGVAAAKTRRLALHGLRNAFQYSGNVAWFYAVTLIALADLSALQFTMPLFTIVMAAFFLSERIGVHRWIATAIGFAGALVILRPGFAEIGLGALLALAAAFLYSASFTITKSLSSTESGNVVVFYMSVFIVVFAAIPAAFVWQTPSWADMPAIIGLGITGYTTHYCVTKSMAAADASYVVPFDFLRLPFSAFLGALLFAESSPVWTWIGAVVIFGAAYYNTWQEKRAGGRPLR